MKSENWNFRTCREKHKDRNGNKKIVLHKEYVILNVNVGTSEILNTYEKN
jgi:hypothetical protein